MGDLLDRYAFIRNFEIMSLCRFVNLTTAISAISPVTRELTEDLRCDEYWTDDEISAKRKNKE